MFCKVSFFILVLGIIGGNVDSLYSSTIVEEVVIQDIEIKEEIKPEEQDQKVEEEEINIVEMQEALSEIKKDKSLDAINTLFQDLDLIDSIENGDANVEEIEGVDDEEIKLESFQKTKLLYLLLREHARDNKVLWASGTVGTVAVIGIVAYLLCNKD